MDLRTILLAIALGVDVFAGGLSLGVRGIPRSRWISVAVLFAGIALLLTSIGYQVGEGLDGWLGNSASYLAGFVLVLVGLRALLKARRGGSSHERGTPGWVSLALIGLMVCIDKLAVGFTLPFIDFNAYALMGAIGLICFFATLLGLRMGKRLGASGEHVAEYVAGGLFVALGLLVIWKSTNG